VLQGACGLCPKGQTPQDALTCVDCDTGHFVDASGLCVPCPVGFVQPLSGQTACSACEAGKLAENGLVCSLCPEQTYNPISNATSCLR
jgi:hypothetical protein